MDDDDGNCLQDLFTNTSYEEVRVDINGIKVDLFASQSATTDPELTGQLIWPVSTLLAHYLASPIGEKLVKNRNVVELGAGCALPSIVASSNAKHVVLTDGNELVMDLMKKNTRFVQCPSSVRQLVWGNRQHLKDVMKCSPDGCVDVVIAADVVQWPAVVEPLVHTIKALLWRNAGTATCDDGEDASPAKVCLLGLVRRSSSTTKLFFDFCLEMGFVCRKVDDGLFLPSGVPDNCKECGGQVTELFELTLSDDYSTMPLLLEDGIDGDLILGKDFELTSFMPC